MEFADDSLPYCKHDTTMTDQPNAQSPQDDLPVIRNIGRLMFYVEISVFLVLGLLVLLDSAGNWLGDVLR
jgi:hypothetical protein